MKLLQDLANKGCKEETEKMQYRTAKEKLREKELKMKKEQVIRTLYNKRRIEILYKIR